MHLQAGHDTCYDQSMKLEQLGPYKLEKKLGRGGMGTVYAAVDVTTGNRVAVKVLAPVLATEEGFRERFEGEIESLQQLNHPNIVQLFGFGEQASYLYYAMELVEGSSLEEELIKGRRFQWRDVCHIALDLCRALKIAHDHGIIHRDIKPANLLWTSEGQVKLTDFGIARLFGNTGLTTDGGVLGTAEYMAPEQAGGRPVTHRCDLYSLGGVMYALLAGRPPFRSKSMLEMLQMQRYSEPKGVCHYAPDTPVEMEEIISQLLEKDPQKRFPNALMVARRLEAMERGLSLRTERELQMATSDTDGFEIKPYGVESSAAGMGDTLDITEVVPPSDQTQDGVTVDQSGGTKSPHIASLESATDQETGSDQFMTASEAKQQIESLHRRKNPLIALPTWILAISLACTVAVVWYFLQPPTADRLYEQIARASHGDERQLLEIENGLTAFLKHYPDDPRSQSVRDIQQQLQILHLERRAKSQARLLNKRYPASPIGPEYLAAIELADSAPEKAAARLHSLIALYHQPGQPPSISVFLDAAKKQLPQIERQVKERAKATLPLLEQRVQKALDAFPQNPETTREICRAIVVLYRDKPWAEDVVFRAQEMLRRLNQSAAP